MHLRAILLLMLLPSVLSAQVNNPPKGTLYDDAVLPRIDIQIAQSALDAIYEDVWSNFEHPATFSFTHPDHTDVIESVGFRLRGNTSRASAKKSFKISFNTFTPGGKYQGVEKLNLNGEHNDPSISRAKICWDILRDMEVPASRANHVELYINGDYYGLYLNIEHIDENFLEERFGNNDGNFYKCLWPSDLTYHGDAPNDYTYFGYNLKNNFDSYDISDLISFIDALNNSSTEDLKCELEDVFNVQQYLKIMAFDVLTGNWDGYYNKNNFYLYYNERSGLLEYIPYDLDNTLGIDWLGIDWTAMDIYNWTNTSEARPLLTRLLHVEEYYNRFSFYLSRISESFMDEALYEKMDQTKEMITEAAFNDDFRVIDYGFTDNDFLESFDTAWGNHVDRGIKEFISARKASVLLQLEEYKYPPLISNVRYSIPSADRPMYFRVNVFSDSDLAAVGLNYNDNDENFGTLVMTETDPGVYELELPYEQVEGFYNFNFNATDIDNNTGVSHCEMFSIPLHGAQGNVRINELMARNASTAADEEGDFDDWLELYNTTDVPIWLGDLMISDNPYWAEKWNLPNGMLEAGEFKLIWADGDESEGEFHSNFKLSGAGEEVSVYSKTNSQNPPFLLEDYVSWQEQTEDVSIGLVADGEGTLQTLPFATPGWSNESGVGIEVLDSDELSIRGHNDFITLTNASQMEIDGLFLYSKTGQFIGAKRISSSDTRIEVHCQVPSSGIYVVLLRNQKGQLFSESIFLGSR